MLFSLWAVSASSNFPVADFASKQSTQRAFFFILQQLKHPGVVLTSIMQQPGGFGCMWALFVSPW
jgi:hypothetical protein